MYTSSYLNFNEHHWNQTKLSLFYIYRHAYIYISFMAFFIASKWAENWNTQEGSKKSKKKKKKKLSMFAISN